jgi:5-methylcytosine-specific restriction endonuclease McrA
MESVPVQLEFDHIIPHAKGGANTEGNVRLLCRRCNNEKGDRI